MPQGHTLSNMVTFTCLEPDKILLRRSLLTLRCRSSSLHAKEVSRMYQSGNKYKKFDNQVMNDFMDVSIGKQNIKIMKNIVF